MAGGGEEMGSRDGDISTLYRTNNWEDAASIIARYKIRYIYIGPSERGTYKVEEEKFTANLVRVFSNASVTIYEVPQSGVLTQIDTNNPARLP
jgi:uncharacterized membrane protein